MKNKSQAWGIDLIVATAIFLVTMVIFFVYSINQTGELRETIEDLLYEGEVISNSILSEGYPKGWDSENVVKIGILSENKINKTKLERFYELSETDYSKTKNLFNTKYDYYFFLEENMIIDSGEIGGIGKPGTDKDNIDAENLIKLTRFTIYEERPVTAYLYVWEE